MISAETWFSSHCRFNIVHGCGLLVRQWGSDCTQNRSSGDKHSIQMSDVTQEKREFYILNGESNLRSTGNNIYHMDRLSYNIQWIILI